MESYRNLCLAERGAGHDRARGDGKPNGPARLSAQDARRRAAEARAQLSPLKRRVAEAEAEIERLTAKIAAIDATLADGALYARDAACAQALARERGALERARATAEAAWLEASEAYEAAQAKAAAGIGP
jgi:ATP-binding cassette subfamily F protein 3